MTSVDSIHRQRIDERQNYENKNGPLLGEPKTQGETAEGEMIKRLNEDDAEKIGDHKPDRKEHDHQAKVLTPMDVR